MKRCDIIRRLLSSRRSTAIGSDIVSPLIGLTNEQSEFYRTAKLFSDNELRPHAKKWDDTSFLSIDALRKAASFGFAGLLVTQEYGGSALSRVDSTVIIEALATGCVGTTAMLTIHNMCAAMLDKFGSSELRSAYLPRLTSMQYMASYCLTEPSSGSDAASLRTTARKDTTANEYVINGGKAFISGAGLSDVYLVMCRTTDIKEPHPGISNAKGISCILVPKDTPGLSFGSNESKMGWRVQPTRQVHFDNVRVPVSNRVGTEGEGFSMAMAALDGGRLSIGSCSLGAAQACFEIALEYTKERTQFGCKVAAFQATQFKLVDMAGKIITARLMLRNAAALLDAEDPSATSHCALAKKIATDNGFEVCNAALQLLGGYGYLKDYDVERYVRDVRVHQILEGTNEIMSVIVGKSLTA